MHAFGAHRDRGRTPPERGWRRPARGHVAPLRHRPRRLSPARAKLWTRSRLPAQTDTPGIGSGRDGWHTRRLTPIPQPTTT